jgi:L-threonylcarbamoyladenylate synthase
MADFETDIEHCLNVLEQGGTILYPTDTIWGIGCDATNAEAVEKIFAIKERPGTKTMIILLPDEKDLLRYVANPDPQVFDFLKNTTKPTTVIYPGAIGLADNLVHEDGTVAVRVVQEKFCRHLLKRFRKPIVSTSANISGDPPPKKFNEILNHVRTSVDYVVTYRQDDETEAESSALVRFDNNGEAVYLRP